MQTRADMVAMADKQQHRSQAGASGFWPGWDRFWDRVPGTRTKGTWEGSLGPVVDPRSMNIGMALGALFIAVLLCPMLFGFSPSQDALVLVPWVAGLLILGCLAATFILRGRGVRR
jgi:hypothetical protein